MKCSAWLNGQPPCERDLQQEGFNPSMEDIGTANCQVARCSHVLEPVAERVSGAFLQELQNLPVEA